MDLKGGGNALRRRRKQRELTIEDVVRELREKRNVSMDSSDISRMENGRITSPSLDKTMAYGLFLGMTPGEIAQAYGLYTLLLDGRVTDLGHQLQTLPVEIRFKLLDTFDSLVRSAIYEQNNKHKS